MSALSYTAASVAAILGAARYGANGDFPVRYLLTDSRRLLFPEQTLFIALEGPRRSGIDFIPALYQRGVRTFLVSQSAAWQEILSECPEATFLVVPDAKTALQQLAAAHRQQFSLPVVGITGSNGKTIVKEWLFQLLQDDYDVVRSPRSFNSQIGVPLSVWQIQAHHNLGLFEAGISRPNEMAALAEIIQPSLTIFTSLGAAHDEGFASRSEKVAEKLNLFKSASVWIYPADEPTIQLELAALVTAPNAPTPTKISWGREPSATLQVLAIAVQGKTTQVEARWMEENTGVQHSLLLVIPFTDSASVDNALCCYCVLRHLQLSHDLIQSRMLRLQPVAMRLERKPGIQQCSLINDSYSADLDSLTIALDFLAQQEANRRSVILSDILESGRDEEALYTAVAAVCAQYQIQKLVGIGPKIQQYQSLFSAIPERWFFADTELFLEQRHRIHFQQETILLKGARRFGFERISRYLEAGHHQTRMEIDLSALYHNLRVYQSMLQPSVRMMVMVKAAGYGTGSDEVAAGLQFHGVDYLAVAYTDEGVELRRSGITLPIMVMNPDADDIESLVSFALEPEVYSISLLESLGQYLRSNGLQHFPVHLKLDTGMHRLGFGETDFPALEAWLKQWPESIKVQSVFSHLVASESASEDAFTEQQAALFVQMSNSLESVLGYSFIRHLSNTAGIHRHPNLQFDMVRLGIGIYGVDSDPQVQSRLLPVARLTTHIAQIRTVAAGETVGYGRAGKITRPSRIATVRIGYADGYPRRLSNGVGQMVVLGQRVPVVGRVCMDMTMLDVTDVPAVQEGDAVTVFGAELPVQELAKSADTIAYEILTGISRRVKRVYYEE